MNINLINYNNDANNNNNFQDKTYETEYKFSENEDDRCCDYCNDSEVITARIKDLFR